MGPVEEACLVISFIGSLKGREFLRVVNGTFLGLSSWFKKKMSFRQPDDPNAFRGEEEDEELGEREEGGGEQAPAPPSKPPPPPAAAAVARPPRPPPPEAHTKPVVLVAVAAAVALGLAGVGVALWLLVFSKKNAAVDDPKKPPGCKANTDCPTGQVCGTGSGGSYKYCQAPPDELCRQKNTLCGGPQFCRRKASDNTEACYCNEWQTVPNSEVGQTPPICVAAPGAAVGALKAAYAAAGGLESDLATSGGASYLKWHSGDGGYWSLAAIEKMIRDPSARLAAFEGANQLPGLSPGDKFDPKTGTLPVQNTDRTDPMRRSAYCAKNIDAPDKMTFSKCAPNSVCINGACVVMQPLPNAPVPMPGVRQSVVTTVIVCSCLLGLYVVILGVVSFNSHRRKRTANEIWIQQHEKNELVLANSARVPGPVSGEEPWIQIHPFAQY